MEPDAAIIRFCLAELRAAGRRMRHRLQRFPATGIYGDDYRHRTLWDELRQEIANGPTPVLESAWDETLHPFAADVVAKMPTHSKALLSWQLAGLDEGDPNDVINEGALENAVREASKELAAQ